MRQTMLTSPVGQFLMEIQIQPIVVLVIKMYSSIDWVCYMQSSYENVHWRTDTQKTDRHTHTRASSGCRESSTTSIFEAPSTLKNEEMSKQSGKSGVYFTNSGWMIDSFQSFQQCGNTRSSGVQKGEKVNNCHVSSHVPHALWIRAAVTHCFRAVWVVTLTAFSSSLGSHYLVAREPDQLYKCQDLLRPENQTLRGKNAITAFVHCTWTWWLCLWPQELLRTTAPSLTHRHPHSHGKEQGKDSMPLTSTVCSLHNTCRNSKVGSLGRGICIYIK